MKGPEALQSAWEQLAAPPDTLRGMVELLGGPKIVGQILGLKDQTGRDVNRYINREEHGKTKWNRQISEDKRDIVEKAAAAAANAAALANVRKNGLNASAYGDVNVFGNKDYNGHRHVRPMLGPIEGDDLADMLDAIGQGDWDEAYDAFEDELMDAYGIPESDFEEIDSLDLDFPD